MKVYFAGFSYALPKSHPALDWPVRELVSFWDQTRGTKKLDRVLSRPDVFLDSGAFSAWTRKVEIKLADYIDFVRRYKDRVSVYANLDVIGDAQATWDNQKEMEKNGLNPLPVFHSGKEDFSWLKKIADGYEYFGVGGVAGKDITVPQIIKHLDQIFGYLVDKKGQVRHKVHGFGITTLPIMLRYPFFSVDSTAWVLQGRFGGIFIQLDGRVLAVSVSDRSPDQKKVGKHYKTLSGLEQKVVEDIVNKNGFTMEQVAKDYQARDIINIRFFQELERTWKRVDFNPGIVQGSFF